MLRTHSIAFLVAIVLAPVAAPVAQTGFEDQTGRSSIVLKRGGLAKFNVTASRLSIAVAHTESDSVGQRIRAGAEVSAKATDGIASVLTTDGGAKFAAETRGRLSIGVQGLFSPARNPIPEGDGGPAVGPDGVGAVPIAQGDSPFIVDDWAGIEVGYERAEYTLLGDLASADPMSKEAFDGGIIRAYYNALLSPNAIVGVSIGADRRNNYSQLEKASFVQEVVTRVDGDTTFTVTQTVSGRTGTYDATWGAAAAADLVFLPRSLGGNIGLAGYLRYASHDFLDDRLVQGLALVVTERGKPSQVVGSVSVEFVEGEVRAGLVAGFSFGGGS